VLFTLSSAFAGNRACGQEKREYLDEPARALGNQHAKGTHIGM
jgi:hypothetical protein